MMRRLISVLLAIVLTLSSLVPASLAQQQNDTKVNTTGPTSTAQGTSKIQPAQGTEGTGASYNFLPYSLPGQYPNPDTQQIENQAFDIAYAARRQPVQTSDWWTGIGLQWSNDQQTAGWVVGRSEAEGKAGHSKGFIAEPFTMNFIDYGDSPANQILGINPLPAGLRLWNANKLSVQTKGKVTTDADEKFDASNNYAGFGNPAEPAPAVTVGLAGVHPLGVDVRRQAPWSNVKVQSYSDWGAVVSYADTPGEMTITMAAGSPFVWFERTKGAAAFQVWAGDPKPAEGGALNVWYNQGNVLGVTVTTVYVPFNGLPTVGSPASYVIYADQGNWAEQKATNGAPLSLFTNATATRAAVLALPHNLDPSNTAALIAAKDDLGKYATVKITDTRLHYPPVVGSDAAATLSNGQSQALGFDEKNGVVRSKLQVTTAPFPINGFAGSTPVQLVFPHHRKAMIADSQKNILTTSDAPQYVWNGVIGQYFAYAGASYVRELANPGGLPFLPGVAMNAALQNPLQAGQSAADDVYQTMKTWFFVQEEVLPGVDRDGDPIPANIGSFARNLGTYVNVQTNSYIQGISGVYEMMMVAEQLSRAPQLAGTDADFGKTKQQVAAEMRDYLLQTLKELVGQWADVYTAQFFWYNPQYNSLFGFPQGYGSIQNFNDHHFHYSYFLRAAAAIGRYDKEWLNAYLPFIDQIRRDVATYDRHDTSYPFLREFSPFYGHNWADGTGQDGQNQESVSEAMNFAYGLIELGQILGDQKLRDLGVYLFAEEELAAQQYWFNSDADLTAPSNQPYNGNWPSSLVHYTGPNGRLWKTTLVTNVKQFGIFRSTFFGGIAGVYTIQQTPLAAYALFFGRNQNWLRETWQQYLLDSGGAPQGPYETIVAAIQAQLPQSGTNLTDVGLTPALKRINATHNFFPGAPNAHAKHWAYSLAALGQVDFNVVADTTTYAVFNNAGQRTYTAYNPSDNDITVTFTDRTSGAKTTLQVPARTMASKLPNGPDNIDRIAPYTPDARRLYLRSNNALSHTPGTWMLPAGQTTFPSDISALAANLVAIPVRSDQAGGAPQTPAQTPPFPPPAADTRSWTGTFSGKLVTDPKQQVTRFSLYTNQALFPGWQQDPSVAGNTATVRFIYDFNSDGKPDRIEALLNAPLSTGNAFLYENKLTEYTGDRLFNGPIGRGTIFLGGPDANGAIVYTDPFPREVTNGTLTVQFYGGSNPNTPLLHPYFVSQDASPLTNRASWVKPPYQSDPTQVTPGADQSECATICLASPRYYLRNLNRLPAGFVLIAGGGINPLISTSNTSAMRFALDGGNSAQDRFNEQFVALQLSLLAAPGNDTAALSSKLGCYGINFAPVTLGNGAAITPNATLGTLLDYVRAAARSGSGDLAPLTILLSQLNGQCRR